MTIRDLSCPGCGAPVHLEEKASYRTGKLIYYCKPCLTRYGLALQEEEAPPASPTSDMSAQTQRLRVQRKMPPKTASLEELISPGERAPLPPGVALTLELAEGPDDGRAIKVEWSRAVLGREAADILIADPGISRRHALLEIYDAETVLLKDLSSTNGTYHNGRLIDHCKLQDGDEIRLGTTLINILLDPAA